jgi:hypothetical protein
MAAGRISFKHELPKQLANLVFTWEVVTTKEVAQ